MRVFGRTTEMGQGNIGDAGAQELQHRDAEPNADGIDAQENRAQPDSNQAVDQPGMEQIHGFDAANLEAEMHELTEGVAINRKGRTEACHFPNNDCRNGRIDKLLTYEAPNSKAKHGHRHSNDSR